MRLCKNQYLKHEIKKRILVSHRNLMDKTKKRNVSDANGACIKYEMATSFQKMDTHYH